MEVASKHDRAFSDDCYVELLCASLWPQSARSFSLAFVLLLLARSQQKSSASRSEWLTSPPILQFSALSLFFACCSSPTTLRRPLTVTGRPAGREKLHSSSSLGANKNKNKNKNKTSERELELAHCARRGRSPWSSRTKQERRAIRRTTAARVALTHVQSMNFPLQLATGHWPLLSRVVSRVAARWSWTLPAGGQVHQVAPNGSERERVWRSQRIDDGFLAVFGMGDERRARRLTVSPKGCFLRAARKSQRGRE